jgi:hypothetical protein
MQHGQLQIWRRTLSDSEPIHLPRGAASLRKPRQHKTRGGRGHPAPISFDRRELNQLLGMYGRKVAEGEWRDYAIDMLREKAVFSVFRIEKDPRLARRQGAYSVIAPTGLIVKRGHDLNKVLRAIDRTLRLVPA